MRSHTPTPRLRHRAVGDPVRLVGDPFSRKLTIGAVRDDGLFSLTNQDGVEVVIAVASHEIHAEDSTQ